jgi:hypothetical protein
MFEGPAFTLMPEHVLLNKNSTQVIIFGAKAEIMPAACPSPACR